jgi:MoxR-like ATPase
MTPTEVQAVAERIVANVGRAMVGVDEAVRLVVLALLADGHVLIEDVPGTGKTTLAKALARTLGLSFARIQFTPDLLPSDVTGLYWFNQRAGTFEFRAGPVFAQVLLADEINRATPRTQSALLEAMAERQVTVEGHTHPLPEPFVVLATQNPIELEGTFPLPEAQVDRFLVRLGLGYPDEGAENDLVLRHGVREALADVAPLAGLAALTELRAAARAVAVNEAVRGYIVKVCRATRAYPGIELGASPRGTLFLVRAAQARAVMAGRAYVIPDDVKAVAGPVLAHRLITDPALRLRGGSAEELVLQILATVPVPVEE